MKFLLHTQYGWHPIAPPCLNNYQKSWLFRMGPLTYGLKQLGALKLSVLREMATGLKVDEASGLRCLPKSPVWIREVMMSIHDTPCIVARSLTPLAASHGVWQKIRRLHIRPLADILYHRSSISRSPFVCRRLNPSVPLYTTVVNAIEQCRFFTYYSLQPHSLWARRSVFWRHGQPLMVAECFLPAFWKLADKKVVTSFT